MTAANAQRREAFLSVAFDHFVQQGDQHAAAGAADRVAEGDGAAIDVDLAGVPVEFLANCQGLRGEGFVGFDQVQVSQLPAGLGQAALGSAG